MPIAPSPLDNRKYDDLVAESLARIPVHTPEWTNFNRSDPGVTLVEVFAFLTESLLYRANQIPERNRRKFLQLLRIPLNSATAAQGLVTITNAAPSTDPSAVVLNDGLEVRAGQVPFRTERAVDVLPVEGRLYVKSKITDASPDVKKYYQQLYASYRGTPAELEPQLYQSAPFPTREGVALSLSDTVDRAVWLALLVRDSDTRSGLTPDKLRTVIANRTLTLGVVPSLAENTATLPSGRAFASTGSVTLRVDAPNVPQSGGLPDDIAQRVANYGPLAARPDGDLLAVPGVLDVTLPDSSGLRLWNNIDPLEAGVNGLPPAIEDPAVDARVITWLRVTLSSEATASFLWMGINAVPVTQRARVTSESLPDGSGEPDQVLQLAAAPVLPASVELTITPVGGDAQQWTETDDLLAAGAEVPVPDARLAPGAIQPRSKQDSKVFTLDAESGDVRFGDGTHGARPPEGATIRATYDYAVGADGNVGPATINSSPSLPEGFKVNNPIATWGGAEAESVSDGEKQVARYLQHRDRLVTATDFVTLTLRTPGVEIARVEVLPNFKPDAGGGEMPGAVTLMLVPLDDPAQPDAPLPRQPFLDAVCRYLDPRRLVTTEVILRGPAYTGIWISVGIKVGAGFVDSDITEAVKAQLLDFLAPSAGIVQSLPDVPLQLFAAGSVSDNGWQLGKSVIALELAAVAARVKGVEFVQENLILADEGGTILPRIDMTGLQLPRVLGIRVVNGAPASLDELRGTNTGTTTVTPTFLQIPAIPEECH